MQNDTSVLKWVIDYQTQPYPNTFLKQELSKKNVWFSDLGVYLSSKAFVWKNNVYVKTSPTSPAQQVTFSGEDNKIFNGIPDWVYEGKRNRLCGIYNAHLHSGVALEDLIVTATLGAFPGPACPGGGSAG